MALIDKLNAIGDAIRSKTGKTDKLTLDQMPTEIEAIETGVDTSDATATSDEIFSGETAYTADGKVTGTFTIEEELTEQNDLISQILTLVAQKANPPSSEANLETVTITYEDAPDPGAMVYYLDGTMTLQEAAISEGASYTVLKGSILVTSGLMTVFPTCTSIIGNSSCRAQLATGE